MRQLCLVMILACLSSAASAFDHTYQKWDKFLKTYVVLVGESASQVQYSRAKNDRKLLDEYAQDVQNVSRGEYDRWTSAEQQAFLINAYNALTVKLILDKGIPASIKDIGSIFRNTWKQKFFKFFGEDSYLDRIEHELARASFNNCRFHFAFNCASVGCPMLRNEAWLPAKLPEQFEDSARRFVGDPSRNRYNPQGNYLELSKIFDWYGDDFVKDKSCGGSVRAFVGRYLKGPGGKPVPESAALKYLPYDWSLNSAK